MRQGLYMSYDERKNGPFAEAVRISQELDWVTWLDRSPLDPKKLACPTTIFVRLKGKEGKERYFVGELIAVHSAIDLPADFENEQRNHRPVLWWQAKKESFQSALRIRCLREVAKPHEVDGQRPPQRPTYVGLQVPPSDSD